MKASQVGSWILLAVGLSLVLVAGVPAAKEPLPDSGSALDRADRALRGIQGMVLNSGSRLRKGLQGMSSGEPAEQTPGMSCCAENMTRIVEHMQAFGRAIQEFAAHELKPDQHEAQAVLPLLRVEFQRLAQEIERFRTAPDVPRAQEALDRMVPPFNKMRQDAEFLRNCCGPPRPTPLPEESPAQ
jgi:hypothetical protein